MNKKLLGSLLAIIVVAIVSPAIYFSLPKQVPTEPQQNIDVVITGENTCLRFLEKNVSTCYIPFRTEANEQWRLAIECLEMPNQNAWTDLYLYRDYWNGGTDYKCLSEDIYPIIDEIETTGQKFKANSTFTETFGEGTPQAYTVFFLFPTGGSGTFHIELNLAD
jgi:hypothetical protein